MSSSRSLQLWRRVGFILVAIFVVFIASLVGACWYLRSLTTGRLENLVAAIRAEGYPMSAEEMNEWYTTEPSARQAGEEFVVLFKTYKAGMEYDPKLPWAGPTDDLVSLNGVVAEDVIAASKQHLAINADYMIALEALTQNYPEVHFPMDFSKGESMEIRHLAEVRRASRMALLQLFTSVVSRDVDRAIEGLDLNIRIGDTLSREPYVIGQLVRIGCYGIAVESTEQLLNRARLSDEQLSKVDALWNDVDVHGMIQRGLIGDRCLLIGQALREGWRAFDEKAGADVPSLQSLSFVPGSGVYLDLELCHLVEGYNGVIRAGDKSVWVRTTLTEAAIEPFLKPPHFGKILAGIYLPGFNHIYAAENRVLAEIGCVHSAVQTLRYVLKEGSLADDLPTMIGSVPDDPYNGQPIKFRREGNGFIVYSIGMDLDDDGGRPRASHSNSTDGDTVVQVVDVSPYLRND